jgi:hypothetical protein
MIVAVVSAVGVVLRGWYLVVALRVAVVTELMILMLLSV